MIILKGQHKFLTIANLKYEQIHKAHFGYNLWHL